MVYIKAEKRRTYHVPAVSSFSELLADIPSNETLAELFATYPAPEGQRSQP